MDIYSIENWLQKKYNSNLLRKDIIERLFNKLIFDLKKNGLIIKNENRLYCDFLIYIIKYSN